MAPSFLSFAAVRNLADAAQRLLREVDRVTLAGHLVPLAEFDDARVEVVAAISNLPPLAQPHQEEA